MEEEAPARCSVAELAGRFKGSAPPHDAAGQETEKPVRRRPPRSLQLPKTHADNQEPAGVTSSLPAKAKRNSALIEKLQANLALSPTALLPSPKSPGFRLLPPAFPLPSSGSAPVTTVTPTPTPTPSTPISPVVASPLTKEEGPATFEAPPTAAEGSILSNINKGRARHSIRRRPPSRRSRKSSSGDDVNNTIDGGDTCLSSPNEPKDETREEEGEGEKKEDKPDEVTEEKTETKNETQEEEHSETNAEPREEDKIEEKEERQTGIEGRDGGDGSSSGIEKEEEEEEEKEEKNSAEKHEEESTETPTNTDSKEEEKSQETVCQSPAS